MMKTPQLLGPNGSPIARSILTSEIGGATVGGVRSPLTNYPADGLNPLRLAQIIREADAGDPVRYLELLETIEERDPHYMGVLGTRRRAVAGIEITVEPATESAEDEERAQLVREWLKRDELTTEIFNILDCISKGYSLTEIIWEASEGQLSPVRLEHRDPRWFRFARHDLRTPLLIDNSGQERPLDPGKWIFATIPSKSGIPIRSGVGRLATWGWMFKAYAQRDWAIFRQTYGQPVRLGKFGPGASKEDQDTLFRAVSNIAGDCAAIIPDSMMIEFIEAGNLGSGHTVYKESADWIDQQISKAVLGQTATTDALTGGMGSGKEHREVQKDIETADARALAAILNRDLVQPWMQLEFGAQKAYPRIRIARVEQEDIKSLADALGVMIDRGLEVEQAAILTRFGLPEATTGAKLLRPSGGGAPVSEPAPADREIKGISGEIKRVEQVSDTETALQAQGALAGEKTGGAPEDVLAARMAAEAAPAMGALLDQIEAMVAAAGSLAELREMILAGFPQIDAAALADVLALGLVAANAGGQIAAAEEAM